MNPHNRTPGYKYRLCCKCGLEWNVARNQNERKYICPYCDGKKEDKNNGKGKKAKKAN